MATFLTVANIKTSIINHKDNVGGANDTQIIEWCEFMNRFLYPQFAAINPNDYLSNQIIKTVVGTSAYALPSNWQDLRVGGIFETKTGTDFGAISFDAQTVNFSTIGQTITGGTSGATGTLSSFTDYGTTGTLVLTSVSGTFQDNETLTGSTEGSATSNGTLTSYRYDQNQIVETGFGSQQIGFWCDASNINFTPTPTQSKVYVNRYLPTLTTLSALSDETIVPVQYREFGRSSADVYWNQWRGDSGGESDAGQRAQQALTKLLSTLAKTPTVFLMPDRSHIYTRKRTISRYAPVR